MSEIKNADDIVIDINDSDLDDYLGADDVSPAEEQLDEEAKQSWIPVALTTAEAQELALREQLEGQGYTAEDFHNSKSYLVEAGAGAGKTYIMIQRIVNQLVSGYCEPKDIVAITFTNKSTLEMRNRLDKFLKQRRDALRAIERSSGLTEDEQALKERLERLIREAGQMQISTIHSFCQTMLESMPFASKLGLDMQVLENDDAYARDFLKRKWWEDPQPFEVPRQLGVPTYLLETTFFNCRKNSEAELGYQDVNSPEAVQWKSDLKDAVHNLQRDLHGLNAVPAEIRDQFRTIVEMKPADFAVDADAAKTLIWTCLTNPEHFPLDWNIKEKEEKDAVWQSAEGQAMDVVWLGQWGQLLRTSAQHLIHAYTMRDVEALLAEYRAEKIARHIATYDDLLLRTRDMLRDSSEARAYFHRRYKVIYVDEMQDTDPVQTEMLFYLTTDEAHFDPTNWKNCRPVPGSLFLVGDPKQAIYRFRGADIGVYNDLLSVFHGGAAAVGEKVTLRFNFRSSTNICALADAAFQPMTSAQTQEDHRFVGGQYHAEYVSMNARSGDCPRARTMIYKPGVTDVKEDAKRVAAFIYMMIKTKRYVGIHRPDQKDPQNPEKGKHAHPAQAEDFLILTKGKEEALAYAEALRKLDIAAEVTGEKSFNSTKPIARAVLHLESLLSLRDDHKLLLVLRKCYQLQDEHLQIFMQRAGEHSLTGLVKKEKLEKIQRALQKEPQPDTDLLGVCAALEEIAELRKMARTLPAMAVIERLLEGGYGVWQQDKDAEKLPVRKQIWAEVQQYLNLVRSSRERSFPALATFAIECATADIERELSLEPSGKAVQIMNLHKAKGLEGEIVILALDWQKSFPVSRHVERQSGKATEYRLLTSGYGAMAEVIGTPVDWTRKAEEEAKYLAAEYARLMYVAATRAKTMLLVCDVDGLTDATPYWAPLAAELKKSCADATDPYYGEAFKMLQEIDKDNLPKGTRASGSYKMVNAAAQEETLRSDAQTLAEEKTYPITPSRLEKHTRGVVAHKDKDAEDAGDTDTDKAAETSAVADDFDPDAIPVIAAKTPEAEQNAEHHTGPYGPVWGTMVHRVMELAVQDNSYTDTALQEVARQAVHEMLVSDEMTEKQRGWLGLAAGAKDEEVISQLVPAIVEAASFLKNAESDLRKHIDGAKCYPELSFILQATENDASTGELYTHLAAHISNDKAKDRVLTVNGIIDLAIRKDDGWYIVDYKTDKKNAGETEEAYELRLKGEYTPQITAYARVLEKMNGANTLPVKGAWLCSIPLGGKLIDLDIRPV